MKELIGQYFGVLRYQRKGPGPGIFYGGKIGGIEGDVVLIRRYRPGQGFDDQMKLIPLKYLRKASLFDTQEQMEEHGAFAYGGNEGVSYLREAKKAKR